MYEVGTDMPKMQLLKSNNRADMAVTMKQFDSFQVRKSRPWRLLEVCWTNRPVWSEVES